MLVCHVSDCHGTLPELPRGNYDVIAITGDFLPEAPLIEIGGALKWGGPVIEHAAQLQWLTDNRQQIVEWIGKRTVIWCPGNHDYLNPCGALRGFGIEVIDATDRFVHHLDHVWYGFPYVNFINGLFMHECEEDEMDAEIDLFFERMVKKNGGFMPDVLLCHAPLFGIFDVAGDGRSYGNKLLTHRLELSRPQVPRLYLCGHVHMPGVALWHDGMIISNAGMHPMVVAI